ncbi:hypothetical protein ATANTOWER_002696 [Ataeniobius toweri]|uniref:Uncharacterized protein n=1 Tax=Ataeniobius toweri TaxID=208326 RepID=A0ABU7BM83_9TELE|nr:hypothetical protein [Ataeniobius toweri]
MFTHWSQRGNRAHCRFSLLQLSKDVTRVLFFLFFFTGYSPVNPTQHHHHHQQQQFGEFPPLHPPTHVNHGVYNCPEKTRTGVSVRLEVNKQGKLDGEEQFAPFLTVRPWSAQKLRVATDSGCFL